MNGQKMSVSNNISSNLRINNKYDVNENDISKTHPTRESSFDNSGNKNYIHMEYEKSKTFKQNLHNNVYYKYRCKNMFFKLKKNNEKKVKLETIYSREDFLII